MKNKISILIKLNYDINNKILTARFHIMQNVIIISALSTIIIIINYYKINLNILFFEIILFIFI